MLDTVTILTISTSIIVYTFFSFTYYWEKVCDIYKTKFEFFHNHNNFSIHYCVTAYPDSMGSEAQNSPKPCNLVQKPKKQVGFYFWKVENVP